ncbi:glycosyltransferase family 52 [Kingella negevensis]|uniref:glycosyltransferase family 52 n=1 Tax=Kingella negevensis TaxID=1522312 RepID=UPI002550E091|nr:glycosyltransferase family 52 [Kingella negevensis]MDK4680991.1 glycosyltransferase family 52 [Kingella negevensis]MDK4683193.1 glycosyltransferase family 52 [Kingella negevensis]MDK4691675.1 glycosyltransferase family 52 [Kingella negevensis]MDK4693173.1 glycosyltransferase family 52 [Kingella negevensis]MDK4699474.1 glycosyltransferase family 52 [Kingella negevensis]
MKNLFICLTPLQALIAQALIRQTAPIPADLLMVCYPEADNAKFHHYYQQTAAQCQHSSYQIMPNGRFQREFALPKLLKNLEKSYQTIYAASIDNPIVQYPLSHLNFQALETFDDGTGNLYPNSILYQNPPHSLKRKIINQIQGIHYQTQDLRQLSRQHHTLYPNQPNIVSPTIHVQLWQMQPENQTPFSGCQNTQKILLGQPLFPEAEQNITLAQHIAQKYQILQYFPHPRENYSVDNMEYIDTPLIFEDYLLQQIQKQPETQFHIYHLASTAALNVSHFLRVQIHTIQPNNALFKQQNFTTLYQIMKNMGLHIENLTD